MLLQKGHLKLFLVPATDMLAGRGTRSLMRQLGNWQLGQWPSLSARLCAITKHYSSRTVPYASQ